MNESFFLVFYLYRVRNIYIKYYICIRIMKKIMHQVSSTKLFTETAAEISLNSTSTTKATTRKNRNKSKIKRKQIKQKWKLS